MKHIHTVRKALSLALCAALLGSPVRVLASEALGHDLALTDIQAAAGVRLAAGTFWSDSKSDLRQENYVVYRPGGRVRPVVFCGDNTRQLNTVTEAAQRLEEQGWRVVAGINGDYYGTAHGVPLGCTMADGELRNANRDEYRAVGFRADGSAVIGYPRLALHVDAERPEPVPDAPEETGIVWIDGVPYELGAFYGTEPYESARIENDGPSDPAEPDTAEPEAEEPEAAEPADGAEEAAEPEPDPLPEDFDIFAFNHVRQTYYGFFLYDGRFNDRGTTGTSEPGTEVICSAQSGALTIGGTLTLTVDEVIHDTWDTAVPPGKYVISANNLAGEGTLVAALSRLRPGDRLTVSVRSEAEDADWSGVVQMLGAPELLVEHGQVAAGLPEGSAPRTAVGQRGDGSLILYTIDGRRPGYSVGATLTAVAMRLAELGCETAVALDGGGSTTLNATLPNETRASAVNTPSGSGQRAVSNQLFLVEPNTPSGVPDHVYIAPASRRLLPRAQTVLTAAVIDSNDIPMDLPVSLSADRGTTEGNVLTAPEEPGTVTVSGSAGALSGSETAEVLLPDAIVIRRGASPVTSLLLSPGDSVSLTAEGVFNHLPLTGDNRCFDWTYEGDGVTLSEDGATLTAGETAGAGTLTVSVGDRTASLPVTVSVQPLEVLDDFEAPFEPVEGTLLPAEDADNTEDAEGEADAEEPERPEESGTPPLRLSHSADTQRVRLGLGSARLDYELPEDGGARLPVSYPVDDGYNRAELWVLGDGATTSLALETDAGESEAAAIAFEGWGSVSFTLPAGAKTIRGLILRTTDEGGGTLWLDQLLLGFDGAADGEPPMVTLSLDSETRLLTGRAFDAVNAASLPTLRLCLDGEELPFDFDERTGTLSAALPEDDGRAHNITLTAGDAAGQLARKSIYLPASELLPPAFPDLEGHWAAGAAEYLKRSGVSNGSDGLYLPDSDITRQEFAAMLYRYLGLAAENGASETDEARGGEAEPPETEESAEDAPLPFADTAEIADWALPAARAMYSRGIVVGGKDATGALLYNPRAPITRQEAATMLGRLAERGYTAPPPAYLDAAEIQSWAMEHVALLASFGVFDDLDPTLFEPTRLLTRGEMASLLLRMR